MHRTTVAAAAYFRAWIILGAVCFVLVIGGCETAIDPFTESDVYFSVMGVLNASADTQFVRVAPLRRTIYSEAEPIDAVVTVEHLGSGLRITWRDSLFRYHDGGTTHVFWSTQDIEPGETYRFIVTRADGAGSTASVTLPEEFPDPILTSGAEAPVGAPHDQSIFVPEAQQLVALRVVYTIYFPDQPDRGTERHVVSYLARVRYVGGGAFTSFRAYRELMRELNGCPLLHEAEVFIAAAGPGWPDVVGIDEETQARPDGLTNVQHGTGFLGGVVTKTLPWNLRLLFEKEYAYQSSRGRCRGA